MQITKQKYLELVEAQITLSRLEAGGVDNWASYSESLFPDGESSIEEEIEKIKKTLENET